MKKEGLISLVVVILGFLVGTILILSVGKSPSGMYSAIWQSIVGRMTRSGWSIRYLGNTLKFSGIFILTGLSVAFAYKAGLFNIGAEGQYVVGMTVATVCAFYGPRVPFIHPLYCIIMAIIFSAAYGGIVGFLKAKYEVSEVVATIMLNYIALNLSRIITQALPIEEGKQTFQTAPFPSSVSIKIPFLTRMFGYPAGSYDAIDIGFFIALVVAVGYWFVVEKTTVGYELKATGFNRNAALASGIPINRSIILSMAISGAFAGLAGALNVLGSFECGQIIKAFDNYGFEGIAVALIGNCKAIGVCLSGFLFGILSNSKQLMQSASLPKEIIDIIKGIIVVFIALRAVAIIFRNYISKKLIELKDKDDSNNDVSLNKEITK